MNNYINEKKVKNLGYNLEIFIRLPRHQREKVMLNYLKCNIISLSKEQLDVIFQSKIDDIIERETKKKELIKSLIK